MNVARRWLGLRRVRIITGVERQASDWVGALGYTVTDDRYEWKRIRPWWQLWKGPT